MPEKLGTPIFLIWAYNKNTPTESALVYVGDDEEEALAEFERYEDMDCYFDVLKMVSWE